MVAEEVLGCVMIPAGRFVVAAAHGFVKRLPIFIDVLGKTARLAASRAGVTGCGASVWLELIKMSVHCHRCLKCPSVQPLWDLSGQWTKVVVHHLCAC